MKFPKPTKEELQQMYVVEEKSTKEIGDLIGCADWTISCYLKKYGILTRKGGPKVINLIGQQFGKLLVISKAPKQSRRGGYWICKCECGKERIVCGAALRNKTIFHCGYKHTPNNKSHGHWKGGSFVPASYFNSIAYNSVGRGLKFNLDIKYVDRLFNKQNQKCAISGLPLVFADKDSNRKETTASLDRINNEKGYIKGNVHWVHKDVNKMKWAFELDYFVEICKAVAKHKAPGTIE